FARLDCRLDTDGGPGPTRANRHQCAILITPDERGHDLLFERVRPGGPVGAHFALVDGLVVVLAVSGDQLPQGTQFVQAERTQFFNSVVCQMFAHASPCCVPTWLPASAA